MDLLKFQKKFPNEEACFDHLVKSRWPKGFICPKCGHNEYYQLVRRKLFQCKACHHQASVTAGTVFHRSKLPLQKLFWAMYLVATIKKGMSALELQRKLGIGSYKTAWLLLHKLRKAMVSSGDFPLTISIEADETYIGGQREGKTGRGARGKSLVAVAVETDGKNMGRAYLKKIENASMKELSAFIKERVEIGTNVITDGWPAYKFLFAEYHHEPIRAKEQVHRDELLPKVHIVIANLKMWLRGTFNRYPEKHIQKYLEEFSFRFNRRWNLDNIFDKLLNRCIQTTTITLAELTA